MAVHRIHCHSYSVLSRTRPSLTRTHYHHDPRRHSVLRNQTPSLFHKMTATQAHGYWTAPSTCPTVLRRRMLQCCYGPLMDLRPTDTAGVHPRICLQMRGGYFKCCWCPPRRELVLGRGLWAVLSARGHLPSGPPGSEWQASQANMTTCEGRRLSRKIGSVHYFTRYFSQPAVPAAAA